MAITVKPRTPRVDMHQDILIDRMGEFWKALAEAEGVPDNVLDIELTKFALISTRVDFGEPVDFELALPSDSPETVKDKFLAYLNAECVDLINDAVRAVRQKDTPANSATAPDAPAEDDAKKK